jgi:hypothetical protein
LLIKREPGEEERYNVFAWWFINLKYVSLVPLLNVNPFNDVKNVVYKSLSKQEECASK